MKTPLLELSNSNVNPGGEGATALPTSFCQLHIPSLRGRSPWHRPPGQVSRSNPLHDQQIASSGNTPSSQ
jgi:hypothetical protein